MYPPGQDAHLSEQALLFYTSEHFAKFSKCFTDAGLTARERDCLSRKEARKSWKVLPDDERFEFEDMVRYRDRVEAELTRPDRPEGPRSGPTARREADHAAKVKRARELGDDETDAWERAIVRQPLSLPSFYAGQRRDSIESTNPAASSDEIDELILKRFDAQTQSAKQELIRQYEACQHSADRDQDERGKFRADDLPSLSATKSIKITSSRYNPQEKAKLVADIAKEGTQDFHKLLEMGKGVYRNRTAAGLRSLYNRMGRPVVVVPGPSSQPSTGPATSHALGLSDAHPHMQLHGDQPAIVMPSVAVPLDGAPRPDQAQSNPALGPLAQPAGSGAPSEPTNHQRLGLRVSGGLPDVGGEL